MSRHTRRAVLKVSGALLGGVAVGTTVTAAASTDRYVVDTTNVSRSAVKRADVTVVHDLETVNFAVVEGAESEVSGLTDEYAPDVALELDDPEPNDSAPTASETEDEPGYGLQWDKQVQRIPDVHAVTRGEGTRVTIIDTGVAAGHPDLRHAVNVADSKNFSGDGRGVGKPYGGYHGTHVAGIVAANDANDVGVVGSAPGTEVLDFRVFSDEGSATFGSVVAAMYESAVVGADAANLSLGAYPVPLNEFGAFYGRVLNRVTTWVNSQGTLVVVSAGNDAADLQHDENFVSLPSENARVCSVSATGPIGFRWGEEGVREPPESPAFYTNYGTNAITVAAPGGDADLDAIGTGVSWYHDLVFNAFAQMVTESDGGNGGGSLGESDVEYGYAWAAGTSMAAPQVTAAAALVRSVAPDYNANEVAAALKETAAVPEGYDKTYYGAGFLDPLKAVTFAAEN